jgi:Na+/H+-translocating membrane pyrophosphatase
VKQQVTKIAALLLMLLAGAFGVAVVARADTVTLTICMTLDDYPSISGVAGVLSSLMESGFSPRQAGYKLGEAVEAVCPEHHDLVMRFANALSAPTRIA